jgi:hypothetical protein
VFGQHHHVDDVEDPAAAHGAAHSDYCGLCVWGGRVGEQDVASEPGVLDGDLDLGFGDLENGGYAAEVVEVVDGGTGVDQLVSWRERRDGSFCLIHLAKKKRCIVALKQMEWGIIVSSRLVHGDAIAR